MSPEVRRRRRSRWRRRVKRLSHKRSAVLIGLGLLGALVLALLWCGVTAWRTASDLRDVERQGQLLRAELVDGDVDGAARALEAYQEAAASAESRTDGPTWWLAERIPVLGDDASGVAAVSRVLATLGEDALPPLVDAAGEVTARAFQPAGHEFPLEAIAAVQEPAAESEAAFTDAASELSAIDSSGFIGPIETRYDELRGLVLESRATLGAAYRAARIMPALLGEDGPRDYLLVLQNNAELRPTGGLPGSATLVRADRGKVRIVDQQATARFGSLARPVLPLDKEETAVFGKILGTYFLDANLTPHVPRAAELMAARWEREKGEPVDGVFLVDPVAVSYLLQATGPVDVPGYERVDATNVVAAVENQIYVRSADPEVHDDFQNAVAKAVFNTFADGGGDPAELIRGLVAGVSEGRVRMHSFEEPVQEQLDGTEIAGALPADGSAVGVYLSDSTESKMSYYLDYDVDLVARSCAGNKQDLVGTIRVTNDTPDDVRSLPSSVTGGIFRKGDFVPGQQLVLIYLMTPTGGSLEELAFDGREIDGPVTDPYRGHTVAPLFVTLDPDQSMKIDFNIRTDNGQTGDIDLLVTPGSHAGSESGTVRSAC